MDGGFTAIADSGQYFYATQAGSFAVWRFDFPNGQLRWTDITPAQVSAGTLWLPPFIPDAYDQKIMYLPWRDQLWRNSNLTEIPYIFPPQPTEVNWQRLENISGELITALGMSKAEPRRLYYATFNWTECGRLYRLDNPHRVQPTPLEITGSNFPYYTYSPSIGCIAVDPRDANKLLVIFPNYRVISIYASEDGGNSRSPVAGNLEEYPDGSGSGSSVRWVSILYVDDLPIYLAGTSVGIFSTTKLDGMNTVWVQEGASTIGNVVVDMIDVRQSDGFVAVGTHVNGVYSTYVTELPSGIKEIAARPERFVLFPPYPNPFNQAITIQFLLPKSGRVHVIVYSALGETVEILIDDYLQSGEHSIRWLADRAASGVYFIQLNFERASQSQKVLLIK